jgi:hypothetical protein
VVCAAPATSHIIVTDDGSAANENGRCDEMEGIAWDAVPRNRLLFTPGVRE